MNTSRINQIWWKIALFFVVVVTGCEKTDYLLFDTTQKSALYLAYGLDSARLISRVSEDTVRLNYTFTVLGSPVDYDREIAVKVLETNLSADKFGIAKHVLKAGTVQAVIPVEFYKDLDSQGKKRYVTFRVQDNEHFRILREMTPEHFCFADSVVPVKQPRWWSEDYLGPFSLELYEGFFRLFQELKTNSPVTYEYITSLLGPNLEYDSKNSGTVMWRYKYPMLKYIVYPLYEYYQEHPTEGINVPKPNYYM